MKAKLDEVGGRVLLGDNTGGGAVILVCIRLERVAVWTSTGLPTNSNSAASQEIPRNYRNRRFISAFTSIILTHSNSVHASSSKFLKINFNIILSSTPRSPKCTSSLGSPHPHQNPVCICLLSYALYAPPILSFLIWSPEWYLVRNTEHKAPRYVVFSTPSLPRPLHFTTCVRSSDLGKIWLPPYHSESNCCVGQGEFVGVKVMRKWSRIGETILNSPTGRGKIGQVIFSAKLRGGNYKR